MKKTILGLCAMLMAFFMLGCDKLPTIERMKTISYVVGRTAGYACELSKTKTEVKATIMVVLDKISLVTPESGQTFTEAWTPLIEEELKKRVESGDIDPDEVPMARLALLAATEGLDYIFVKHPQAKEVKELVVVATTSFIEGYKSVVTLTSVADAVEIDPDAYEYIKTRIEASVK